VNVVRLLIKRLEHKNGKGSYYQVWATLGKHSKMECADSAVEAYRLGLVLARELTRSPLRPLSKIVPGAPADEVHVAVTL